MSEHEGNDDFGRAKRKRTTTGSQTDEDPCNNMAEALADINRKLDVALARIQEIEEIKEKPRQMEKENVTLKESLEFAHQSINEQTERANAQEKTISELTKDVRELTQTVAFEKERAIKLESHSRRNNLIFYSIPEEEKESTAKTEDLVFAFLEEKLKMQEETNDISIERAHRLGSVAKKKLENLRARYSQEKQRIKKAKKSGTSSDEVLGALIEASDTFPFVRFLDKYISPRATKSNLV
ncbi:tropomyosin Lep s 1.0101-like [Montipora capricornis]|uniref:tropomyosin Lep s 1.0101-like n=1 Tax=Montipora capricornis TaxID=246305 RepID=UPI0035F17E0C